MGQKAHPYGLRLGYIRDWKSKWFVRRDFGPILHEDLRIRKHINHRLRSAGVSSITIERSSGKVRVWIFTARPGIVIGRGGQEINRIRDEVSKFTRSEVFLDIKEVKIPQADAQLVAQNVALQLEKRVAFRKAMKKAVAAALGKGVGGIKIRCKGRLGGSEIARTEGYKEGKVPLGTFRADVTYGFSEAFTTYGTIGVKVWIYHGDVLVKRQVAERAKELREQLLQKTREHRVREVRAKKVSDEPKAVTVPAEPEAEAPQVSPTADADKAPKPENTKQDS